MSRNTRCFKYGWRDRSVIKSTFLPTVSDMAFSMAIKSNKLLGVVKRTKRSISLVGLASPRACDPNTPANCTPYRSINGLRHKAISLTDNDAVIFSIIAILQYNARKSNFVHHTYMLHQSRIFSLNTLFPICEKVCCDGPDSNTPSGECRRGCLRRLTSANRTLFYLATYNVAISKRECRR